MELKWDAQKNEANVAKHSLDFADARRIFARRIFALLKGEEHGEDRWIGIGLLERRVVVIDYTETKEGTVRVISLRKALSQERKRYERYLRNRTSGTDWAMVDALTDKTIDISEISPLTDAFFRRAQWREPWGTVTVREQRQEIRIQLHENLTKRLDWVVKLTPWLPAMSRFFAFVGLSILIWASLGYLSSSLLPSSLRPPSTPVPVTLSAVLVMLIGTSFLSFYKSTIDEARGYVSEPQIVDEDPARENWEAARRKIQYYMHENLRQVGWIFWLTLIAMFLGFVIIIYGASLQVAPRSQEAARTQLATQIIVTLSGVIVEFIGATFLFVYKSTMAQANNYVSILERINNVGMAELLLNQMKPTGGFSEKTVARVASQILTMRGSEDIKEEPTRPPSGDAAPEKPGSEGPES